MVSTVQKELQDIVWPQCSDYTKFLLQAGVKVAHTPETSHPSGRDLRLLFVDELDLQHDTRQVQAANMRATVHSCHLCQSAQPSAAHMSGELSASCCCIIYEA